MNFIVGDTVVVKSWEEMASEYGVDDVGIKTYVPFANGMRKYCNKIFTVVEVTHNIIGAVYRLNTDEFWYFTDEHLANCNQSEDNVFEEDDTPSILSFDEFIEM